MEISKFDEFIPEKGLDMNFKIPRKRTAEESFGAQASDAYAEYYAQASQAYQAAQVATQTGQAPKTQYNQSQPTSGAATQASVYSNTKPPVQYALPPLPKVDLSVQPPLPPSYGSTTPTGGSVSTFNKNPPPSSVSSDSYSTNASQPPPSLFSRAPPPIISNKFTPNQATSQGDQKEVPNRNWGGATNRNWGGANAFSKDSLATNSGNYGKGQQSNTGNTGNYGAGQQGNNGNYGKGPQGKSGNFGSGQQGNSGNYRIGQQSNSGNFGKGQQSNRNWSGTGNSNWGGGNSSFNRDTNKSNMSNFGGSNRSWGGSNRNFGMETSDNMGNDDYDNFNFGGRNRQGGRDDFGGGNDNFNRSFRGRDDGQGRFERERKWSDPWGNDEFDQGGYNDEDCYREEPGSWERNYGKEEYENEEQNQGGFGNNRRGGFGGRGGNNWRGNRGGNFRGGQGRNFGGDRGFNDYKMNQGRNPGPPMRKEKPKNLAPKEKYVPVLIPDVSDESLPKELRSMFQPLFCKLCSLQMSSNVMANMHYKSKNHDKKLRKYLVEHAEKSGEPLHPRATNTAPQGKKEKEEDTNPKHFHCDICDLPLTGKLHAESHYMGKNHNAVVLGKKAPAGKGRYDSTGKWVRNTDVKVTLAEGEDTFGLAFRKPAEGSSEPVDPSLVPPVVVEKSQPGQFSCSICNVSCTCQDQINMHFNGTKHKKKLKAMGISIENFEPPKENKEEVEGSTPKEVGTDDKWNQDFVSDSLKTYSEDNPYKTGFLF